MRKGLVISVFAILIILPLVFFGCKSRAEKSQEGLGTEAPGLGPMQEGMEATQATELAQGIATETIPPTAAAPATVEKASRLPQENRNKEIQTALRNAGFYAGAIDGKIGHKTKTAIVEFQKAKGLKPDGRVGPKTWAELEKYLAAQ